MSGDDENDRSDNHATDNNGGDDDVGFVNWGANCASEEGNDCNVDCNSIIDLECDGGDDRKHGRVYDATNGEDDEVNDWIV